MYFVQLRIADAAGAFAVVYVIEISGVVKRSRIHRNATMVFAPVVTGLSGCDLRPRRTFHRYKGPWRTDRIHCL
jgi:hypothetical protein